MNWLVLFAFGLLSHASAGVELVRTLEHPAYRGMVEINSNEWSFLAPVGFELLRLDPERRHLDRWTENDQFTILETAFNRILAGGNRNETILIRRLDDSYRVDDPRRALFHMDAALFELKQVLLPVQNLRRLSPRERESIHHKEGVFRELAAATYYFAATLRSQDLLSEDHRWNPILSLARKALRLKLLDLDHRIKVLREFSPRSADRLSLGVLQVLNATEHPEAHSELKLILQDLPDEFSLRASARRYLTRFLLWTLQRTPYVRKAAFWAALGAIPLAAVGAIEPSAVEKGFFLWLGLGVLDFAPDFIFTGPSTALDRLLSLVGRIRATDRSGGLDVCAAKLRS